MPNTNIKRTHILCKHNNLINLFPRSEDSYRRASTFSRINTACACVDRFILHTPWYLSKAVRNWFQMLNFAYKTENRPEFSSPDL